MKRIVFVPLIVSVLLVSCPGPPPVSCGFDPCRIAIGLSPNTPITVQQGNTAAITVTVTSSNGYNSTVELSPTDLPSGVSAAFNPKTVNLGTGGVNTSTLTLTAASTATPTGPVQITVSGTGNGVANTAKLSLTVTGTQGVAISPKPAPNVTATSGAPSTTFTATLTNVTGAVTWSLNPASGLGTLSSATGNTTNYTPPSSVAANTSVTLTASVQGTGLLDTVTITINKDPRITVSGKVLKLDGNPASGVQVQIDDASGSSKPQVTTAADGSFIAQNVLPPYSLSSYLPGTSLTFRPVTWDGVTRSDPTIVLPSFSAFNPSVYVPPPPPAPQTNWFTSCNRADATISGSISSAVPSGSTGFFVFIGEGVSRNRFALDDPGYSYALGSIVGPTSSYTLAVPYDRGLCKTDINGTLIYIEKSGSTYTRTQVITPVAITTGLTTTANITPASATTVSLVATLNAPTGVLNAFMYPSFKIAGVNGLSMHCCGSDFPNPLPSSTQVNAGASQTFIVPSLAGIEYRFHIHGSYFPTQTQSFWSDAAASGNLSLDLLNLVGPLDPTGTLSGSSPFTPTFKFNQVTNTTLYQVHIFKTLGDPYNSTIWTGYTTATSIRLPNLGTPGRLSTGNYYWSVDAIRLRGNPSVNDLLNGQRMVRRNWNFSNSHYYPDDVIGVSYNQDGTPFSVP